jgi:CRISPR-associated protein Cmr1
VLGGRREVLVDIELSVATPLFGGGVAPGVGDEHVPVRGASVRGHLRFWWRACYGHQFASVADLFRREAEIWGRAADAGTATGPSPIRVDIELPPGGEGTKDDHVPWQRELQDDGSEPWRVHWEPYPGYALFPFQGESEDEREPSDWDKPPRPGRVRVRFRLRLTTEPGQSPIHVAALRQAAETAVAAWIFFGGVGARTRRGCGSLWCAEEHLTPTFVSFRPSTAAPPAAEADRWLQIGPHLWLPNLVSGAPVASTLKIPLLHRAKVVIDVPLAANSAWNKAVDLMQRFSQGPNVGRNGGRGRSRWPEPDSARAKWDKLDPRHTPEHPALPSYPRADLRLPIGLQQLGRKPFPVLQGMDPGATRMASPVILKALPISDDRAVPVMLMLNAPHVWDSAAPKVEIRSRLGALTLTPAHLRMAPNALYPDGPGLMAPGRTIRDAFVSWAVQTWAGPEITL